MPGPAPKETRRRRNADTLTPSTVLRADTAAAPRLRDSRAYLPATRAWWQSWVTAPQASLFVGTDWQRLQMLAPLVDRYFRSVDDNRVRPYALVALLAEIRQSESLLGATHVDRLRGRVKIERPEQGPAGPSPDVAVLETYRRMLAGRHD